MQNTNTTVPSSAASPGATGSHPQRVDYARIAPDAYRAQRALESYICQSGLEESLMHLVKVRASYMNGCAYCIDMHTKDARLAGETEQRIYALNAWRETPFFSDRERAALEWTEALTRWAETHVPDEIHARVAAQFDEAELVALTFAVVVINSWNRLAISLRPP